MIQLTPEELQQGLADRGYDTNQYSALQRSDGSIVISKSSASTQGFGQQMGNQQPGFGGSGFSVPQSTTAQPTTSSLGAAATHMGMSALPAIAGTGAIAAMPETAGISGLLLPLIAGLGAGTAASYGQNKLLKAILPEQTYQGLEQTLQQQEQEHPYASMAGGAAANILGGLSPSVSNILKAGGTTAQLLPRLLGAGTRTIPREEMQNLANVLGGGAIQAGIGAGQNLYEQSQQPQPIDYGQALKQAAEQGAIGALFNKVNKLGESLYKFPTTAQTPSRDLVQLRENPTTGSEETQQALQPGTKEVQPTAQQVQDFNIGEDAANKPGYVPFTSIKINKDGQQEYNRPYKDVLKAAKELAPGLVAQKVIPESPLDVSTTVGLDQHTVRQMLDQYYAPQPYDSGSGGLGQDSRFTGGIKNAAQQQAEQHFQMLAKAKAEQEAEQRAQDFQKARAEQVSQQQNAANPPTTGTSVAGPTKPLTENQIRLTSEGIQKALKANQLPPEPPEGRVRLQEEQQVPIKRDDIKPNDLVPALRMPDQSIIPGQKGDTHGDIKFREAKQGNYKAITENPEHGFIDQQTQQFLSREMAQDALGLDEPLHSERLKELQDYQDPNIERSQPEAQVSSAPTSTKTEEGKLPPWADWATRLFKAAGVQRNIRVEPQTGRLYNQKGVPVNGLAFMREGLKEAGAKMTYKQLDTWMHEPGGHIFFEDLLNSPHKQDRDIAQKMLEADQRNPAYKKWLEDNGRTDNRDSQLEFRAQHAGQYFESSVANNQNRVGGFKENWKDLMSAVKLRMSRATSEDASRLLNNRFFTDASFYDTHIRPTKGIGGEALQQGAGNSREVEQRSQEEQQESIIAPNHPEGIGGEHTPVGTDEQQRLYNQEQDRLYREYGQHNANWLEASNDYINNLEHGSGQGQLDIDASRTSQEKEKTNIAESKWRQIEDKSPEALQRNQPEEQKPIERNNTSPEGKLFKPTAAAIDRVRADQTLPAQQRAKVADQFTKLYNQEQNYTGRFVNPMLEANKSLSPEQRSNVLKALYGQRDEGRSMVYSLRTLKEQQAYNKINTALQQMGKERGEYGNNQPVITSNGNLRKFKQDPNYFPSILGREQADTIRKGTDTALINRWKNEFIEHQQREGEGKVTPDVAEQRWNDLTSQIRGDLGSPQKGLGNDAYFNAIRRQEGITLPPSLRENDLGRVLSSYGHRAVADMAWYKHVESNPEMAASMGYKKDGWGKDIPKETLETNPPRTGNEQIQSILEHYRGEVSPSSEFGMSSRNAHAAEHLTSVAILGPITQVHKLLSSVAQTIGYSHPSEVVPALYKGITDNVGGWQRAVDTGAHISPRTARDNINTLLSSSESVANRLGALAELTTKAYTLGGRTDRWMTGFLQASGEHIMASRIAQARAGNKEAQTFLKYFDPDYNPSKLYGPKDIQDMASRFANTIHGSKDPRTLPSYMTKDTEISAFLKLANWQVSSTNSWMRNIFTPAQKGNLTPLLMSSLGSVLGGYVIKKLREELSGGTKTPVPTLEELMASDANKKSGLYGEYLKDNKDLLAYHFMELGSLAGFGGIITSALKGVMDTMHKNQFAGMGTIFPLDEVASSTARIGDQVVAALKNGDSDMMTVLGRATTDWLKQNVQVVRVALNNAEKYGGVAPQDYQRHLYNQRMQDERRYEMASGLPYQDQSAVGSESNPYLTLGEQAFKRNLDLPQALQEQLPPILHKWMNLYGDKPQVLMDKIEGLKNASYETMPNPDENPAGFASYNQWLGMTEGEKEATNRLYDYMEHRAINEAKSSAIP